MSLIRDVYLGHLMLSPGTSFWAGKFERDGHSKDMLNMRGWAGVYI